MNKTELLDKCLSIEFPQTILSEQSLRNNLNYLFYTENISLNSNTCIQLIQHFHHSLWQANIKDHLSPYDAWYDEDFLIKSIENRLKYKGENLSPKDIRAGFSIAKIAPKVSIFRPATAKYLIKKYLNEFTEIFDPCSGYSGRLLGAKALNKNYIGQDINPVTIKESNDLVNHFNFKNVHLQCKNSLATRGEYECLFTCPPYFDKENWNQSIEDLTCDEWIDICLRNYACKRYLFVVDDTVKYTNHIMEEIENKSHFNKNTEKIIFI